MSFETITTPNTCKVRPPRRQALRWWSSQALGGLFLAAAPGSVLAQRTMTKPAPAAMTFGVAQLWFTPPHPIAGQTVTVHMRVDTDGTGTHELPWRIYAGSLLIAQGEHSVSAGQSFEKNATWAPPAGSHMLSARLDPDNLLIEAASARANNIVNVMMTVSAPPNWPVWGAAAWAGTQQAIRAWLPSASLSGVKIAGALAAGGKVIGPSLKTTIKTAMTSANAPDATADKFAQAIADAWQTWHEGLSLPGLPLYPAFLAFPGPNAPPTPAVTTPLATLASSRASAITPLEIKSRLIAQLGASAVETGAAAAIDIYVNTLTARLLTWLPAISVVNAMGSGPVPAYKPPWVMAGPVVGGHVSAAPGVLAGPTF